MSETVGDAGVIYVSFKEGDRLCYKNSGRVLNKYSNIALHSLETRTASDNIDKHQTVSIRCSALDITGDNAGILRHFLYLLANHATQQISVNYILNLCVVVLTTTTYISSVLIKQFL